MEKPLTESFDTQQKMLKNLKGLMLGRVIILTLLLAITFLFQVSEKKYFFIPLTHTFYYFIGFFYFVTIVYALLLKKIKPLKQFTFVQIIIDHLFITLLIYFQGERKVSSLSPLSSPSLEAVLSSISGEPSFPPRYPLFYMAFFFFFNFINGSIP